MPLQNFLVQNYLQEGVARDNRALVHKCWPIHLVSAGLEETMPMLGYLQSKQSHWNSIETYDGGCTTHTRICETVDNIDLKIVPNICWDQWSRKLAVSNDGTIEIMGQWNIIISVFFCSTHERSVPSGARLELEIVSVSETTAACAWKDCRVIAMKDDSMDLLSILKYQWKWPETWTDELRGWRTWHSKRPAFITFKFFLA